MASKISGLVEKISIDSTQHSIASTAYGYCETAAATTPKVVEMTGFQLLEGVTIYVKFKERNNVANPKLKIKYGSGDNDVTAEIPIVQYATAAVGTGDSTTGWYAGAVVSLTYDGTSWVKNQGFNSDSDATGYYHRRIYTNLKAGTGGIDKYVIIMQLPNGRWSGIVPSSQTTASNGTVSPKATGKTASTNQFMLGHVLLMYANATYADGANVGTYNIWSAYSGLIDARYSFNLENTEGNRFIGYTPVYIVGTVSNGLFTLDSTKWWAQALPSSEDGKVYIYIGDAYDWYRLTFVEDKPIYYYKDGAVRLYTDDIYVKKSGDTMTGNLILNATSGDSPSLLFTRNSSLTDWKIVDTVGKLSFQSATDASTWTERAYFKDNSGDFVATSFTGNGSALTNLNASNISSGTLNLARLGNQNKNLVLAGPASGNAAVPSFRALAAADIPDISGTYLKLTGGVMTGNIRRRYSAASTDPMITMLSVNQDIILWEAGHDDGGGISTTTSNHYKLLYKGTGNDGNNSNYLQLCAHKSSDVIAVQIDEIGKVTLPQMATGAADTPIYINSDGVITAGTKLGASAYHADSYFVKAITSTDNAIARFDGTAGQIQNSGVIIDDNNVINGYKTLKYTSRIYPFVTSGEKSAWYKITFPYATATTTNSAKWFMNSFDLHFGGGYNANPSGVAHITYYWYRAANNGAWSLTQEEALIEGTKANKIVFYYRIAEPGILYINNTANVYNGVWIDNLYVDDTALSLDWSTTKIENVAAITNDTNPPLSAYTKLTTTYLYNDSGVLKTNANFEGQYIKGTWLYTSAATAKTSTAKLATIESDNFIYYITPANALKSAVGATQIGGTTTPIYWTGSAFSAGTALSGGAYKDILNNTSAGALGWNSAGNSNANNLRLVNVNTLAYWNGAYSGTSSNLAYYKGGAFGTMAKETATDYAKLASPTFTGTPKSVTPSSSSDNKMIATKEYVDGIVAANDAMVYKGVKAGAATSSSNAYGALTPAANCGDTYKVSVAGFINGLRVEIGDMLICTTDNTAEATSSNYTTIRNNWNIIQTSEGSVSTSSTSSTDNAIARWDSTSGRIIQDSKITIDDNGNLLISHAASATMTADSTNPKITFAENGSQPVHLIYSDYDNYRAPAGLKIIGGASATPAWLEVEGNVYATAFKGKADTAYHTSAAHWSTQSGSPKGVLKVKIKKKQGWMLAFTIRVYQAYTYDDYVISGYNYGSNKWYSPEATILGSESTSKHTVTFGYDDDADSSGYRTLWVSIPVQQYTGIDIFNVTNGYSQITDISDAFEIIHETESTGTAQTTIDCYRPWYRNETVSDATTATNLSAKPSLAASDNNITVTAGGKTSDAFTVPYATSAGGVAWANVSGKPIEFGTYSGALNTNGWKALGGRSSGSKIYISYNNNSATWNSETYSASMVFGCNDTKGLLDIGYNNPIVTFGGSSATGGTDNDPKWYFKLSATSGKTYTFPTTSKTLAAADGSNASGSWGISITGSSASCTGNAATASKLGTSNVGSARRPIYLSGGAPAEANYTVAHFGSAGKSNMNDIGRLYASSGMTNLTSTSNADTPKNGNTYSSSWHLYWDACYTDDPNGANAWVAQIVNRAGTDNWWVRSRSGGTITNGTDWASNWRHLVTSTEAAVGSATQPVFINEDGEAQACDMLQIGGRNLLKNSHSTSQDYTYPSSSYSDKASWTTATVLYGGTYTLSFWAKSTVEGDVVRVHFYNPSNITSVKGSQGQSSTATDGLCNFTLSTVWTKYWVTYTIPIGSSTRSVIIPRLSSGAGTGTVSFMWEKLEAGNQATDWSPAWEDLANATSATKLSNTTAIGSDVKPVYFTSNGVPQATATEMVRAFTATSAGTDLDAYYDSGMYGITSGNVTNYPTGGAAYATLLTVAYRKPSGNAKPDYAWQMGNFTQNSDRLWYRTSIANSWRAWRQIVNIATNIAVGNGTTPVYVTADGEVKACTAYANASVANATNASKISAKLAATTKTYLLGTATAITATATNVDITGDTGVYLTTTAGELSAARHSWNVSGTEKAYTIYNTTDDSIDFVFI